MSNGPPTRSPFSAPRAINVVAPRLSESPTARTITSSEKKGSFRSPTNPIGESTGNDTVVQTYKPDKWDVYLLGITIVIGGQYFCWNAGLEAGLYSYLIAYFLIASAYVTLCSCTSEITGALPFAGGAYGLSRCTLGFYPAFLIGCCEALEYIVYVSTSTISLVKLIVIAEPLLDGYQVWVYTLFYLSALAIHIRGGRVFWIFNMVIGIVSIAILLLFCLGSIPHADFSKYAASDDYPNFVGGTSEFMKVLPLAAWFFVGVEALNLVSDQVEKPKQMVPFGQMACVSTLFITGFSVFIVYISLPPGITTRAAELVPFDNCFTRLFQISRQAATVLSLPATYATAFGFMWCYGKLISALATSRLLPPILSKTSKRYDTPYVALIAGSLLSYSMCLIVHQVPSIENYLFNICIVSGFMSYSGQCIGYVLLKLSYRNIKSSQFRSPFGIPGAIYSLSVWVTSIVAVAGFQGNGGVEIIVFLIMLVLLTIFYYSYSRRRQTFSAQENRILLVAHVTKFNARKVVAARNGRKNKGSSGASSKRTTGAGTHISQFDDNNGSSRAQTPQATTRSTG